jgi:hypothetical protein
MPKKARPESPKVSQAMPATPAFITKVTHIEEPTTTGFIRHTITIMLHKNMILTMMITGRQEFKTVKTKQGRGRK